LGRINRCIELLEQGQPIFYTGTPELSYEAGIRMSKTWADFISIDFEHHPFDTVGLTRFMEGLRDAGTTTSGHVTPTVIVTLPSNAKTADEVRYNSWQIRHVLTAGVHGILHTHCRTPEAVQAFVEECRWPFAKIGVGGKGGLGKGQRGAGGQAAPARIWGLSTNDYMKLSDVWPLNPKGELMLGLKLEDAECLANCEKSAAVPGISFAEWGPGDMGMSLGLPDAHDPPYPKKMDDARKRVQAACDAAGVAFLCSWNDRSMTPEQRARHLLKMGVKVISGADGERMATEGRKISKRKMPV
jgi:4-hydroxy-2-oxoheptanedioate aldolase